MIRPEQFGLAISEENLGEAAPVLLQGGLAYGIRRAAELGFGSVELHIRNPAELDGPALRACADAAGIRISAVGTGLEYGMNGLCLTSADRDNRRRMRLRFEEHIDLAAQLDALVFLGLCRGKAPSSAVKGAYLDLLAEELLPIVEYAEAKGVGLAFEPIVFYLTNLLNTTEETLDFLQRPGLEPIRLLLDTHHMFIEDPDLDAAFRLCARAGPHAGPDRIAHVHLSDSNRRHPGAGKIDYAGVLETLDDLDYSGALSMEAFPYPGGEEAAARGLAHMRGLLGS